MKDFRGVFEDYCIKKARDWEEAIDWAQEEDGIMPEESRIVGAINSIIKGTDAEFFKEFSRVEPVPMDSFFGGIVNPNENEEQVEFVIKDKSSGEFFYVNTEGFDYARYIAWIPFMTSEMSYIERIS